jgi:hypothetical protein
VRIAPQQLVGQPRHGAGRGHGLFEQRGQRNAQASGELFEHHGGRAAFAALDQRDHRTADAAVHGQRIERQLARRAKVAHALGDAVVQAEGFFCCFRHIG